MKVTWEEALERLEIEPDYDPGGGPCPCVHTFLDGGTALLGAHWSLDDVKAAADDYGIEESGPSATAMHHGLVILTDNIGPLFLATKQEAET